MEELISRFRYTARWIEFGVCVVGQYDGIKRLCFSDFAAFFSFCFLLFLPLASSTPDYLPARYIRMRLIAYGGLRIHSNTLETSSFCS